MAFRVDFERRCSSRHLPSIDQVTEELLSTSEGRKSYLQFLQDPNLSPIQRLYGLNAPKPINKEEIRKHTKKIMLRVHPDKRPDPEKEICTKIFQTVLESLKDAISDGVVHRSIIPPFSNPFGHTSNPEMLLHEYCKTEKWNAAKQFIDELNPDQYTDYPGLSMMAVIVFVRLGDLDAAIEKVPCEIDRIKHILIKYQDVMKSLSDIKDPLIREEAKKKLLDILDELRALKGFYEKEQNPEINPDLLVNMIPHHIYVSLKACSQDSKTDYDKFLRLSIRFCPDGLGDEKRKLINELKRWIEAEYDPLPNEMNISEAIYSRGRELCTFLLREDLSLKDSDKNNLNRLLRQFLGEKNIQGLKEVIQFMNNIVEKKSSLSSYSVLPGWAVNWIEEVFAYPDYIRNHVAEWKDKIQGVEFYLEGKKDFAAHYFLKSGEFFSLGLCHLEKYEYDRAIGYWEQLDPTQLNPEVENMILHTMNAHDLLFIAEESIFQSRMHRLKELSDAQLNAIKNKLRQ